MEPKLIQLVAAAIAICAAVASAFVPSDMAGDMRGLSLFLIGWFVLKRPGDVSLFTHPDDMPEKKR